jgi:arylsulfatase A-like enzyme
MAAAQTTDKKPNIIMIMSDDVGTWNISAYHRGMMGGRTPNLDRIANEGALFTDYYGQQSCTAGRAAFITGQNPFRTGLLKVGMPAAKQGLQDKDPTIAELLKPFGYATAQIGKNHLGDAMNICRRYTASMSSTGSSTISTRWKSPTSWKSTSALPSGILVEMTVPDENCSEPPSVDPGSRAIRDSSSAKTVKSGFQYVWSAALSQAKK